MKYSTLVPPAIAVGLWLIWVLVLAIPGALLMFLMLIGPALVIVMVIAIVIGILRYRPRSITPKILRARWALCRSVVLSTVGLGLAMFFPSPTSSPAATAFHWIDFAVYRHDLDVIVRRQHRAGHRPALAAIAIDGFGSIACGIAYDESGELARPVGTQSEGWRAAAAFTELDRDDWNATRLFGNYFWWDAG